MPNNSGSQKVRKPILRAFFLFICNNYFVLLQHKRDGKSNSLEEIKPATILIRNPHYQSPPFNIHFDLNIKGRPSHLLKKEEY
jgi:hypothetical protein